MNVTHNGTSFYYEIIGEGSPVVFIHAGICDSRMWQAQQNPFAAHYRMIRYDMRGYGQTAMADVTYAHHDDLRGLLDHLQIEQTHLVGCSFGGTTALDFALAHPARVRSLTLVGSHPGGMEFDEGELPPQWDALVAARKAGDLAQVAELEVQIWVDGRFRTPDQVPAPIRDQVRTMNLIALQNEALELGHLQPLQPPASERLRTLTVPTLILVGDLDDADILHAADIMTAAIPHARKEVIPGTAHLPNMEKPVEFNRLVLDFLAEVMESERYT